MTKKPTSFIYGSLTFADTDKGVPIHARGQNVTAERVVIGSVFDYFNYQRERAHEYALKDDKYQVLAKLADLAIANITGFRVLASIHDGSPEGIDNQELADRLSLKHGNTIDNMLPVDIDMIDQPQHTIPKQ